MPTNVVEGVEVFFGPILPSNQRSRIEPSNGIYGYRYRTVEYVTAMVEGEDFLVDVVRRCSELAQREFCDGILINEIKCELGPEGWSVRIAFSIHQLEMPAQDDQTRLHHPVLQPWGAARPRNVVITDEEDWLI
jgi:hypothetical protein